ncbi:unnamed protein product [Staurois parvus]|uniref:C2H2-type domain-containing protein n=1 Tax=Staurois parvus TaxID=386267 RepID=A0ABN9FGS2_9NEOB|nr:unnamed protein product [Staurois parvus]
MPRTGSPEDVRAVMECPPMVQIGAPCLQDTSRHIGWRPPRLYLRPPGLLIFHHRIDHRLCLLRPPHLRVLSRTPCQNSLENLSLRPQMSWERRRAASCQTENPRVRKMQRRGGDLLSSDDSFEPYPEKRIAPRKSRHREARKTREPRERKKPGPKPGWKNVIKREREELPTIYKCPYQGCTAVYRGADGMKKHIKEHHEEVRERPCPHPGCNKVFMIDRYLQRHVKLIHTEERNYICDQCGQAFKQRKHLSVHQMRHSGAKPLQCEVCGFQCRQRASLKYHMTKHKAEADLEFACDQCGKRFEKAHNLNVHMSMVHPLTQSPAKPPETEPDTPSGTMEAVKPELAQQLPS